MLLMGISPLDKDSTACLVFNGKVIGAIAEERLSRQKMHKGFPHRAIRELMHRHDIRADDIDMVIYSFLSAKEEARLMKKNRQDYHSRAERMRFTDIFEKFRNLPPPPQKKYNIPGLPEEKLSMDKPWYKALAFRLVSRHDVIGTMFTNYHLNRWMKTASASLLDFERELLDGLQNLGLKEKLVSVDHHLAHAANAYYTSGFDEALILTLDGYGTGLAGSVAVGRDNRIERIHKLHYPTSLGEFYERVTASLGFMPGRHEGKIVGLAAYDDPDILYDTVRSFFEVNNGDVFYRLPHNFVFSRYLASRYARPTVAAAYQKVLEDVGRAYCSHYQRKTGIDNLVLSGGVAANVKLNQRLFEIDGIERIFVHPNMGDGGCSVGGALLIEAEQGLKPYPLDDIYWGPGYSDQDLEDALRSEGLEPQSPGNLEKQVGKLLVEGNIVARFDGRMEYGPRALGNRSILYHAGDPEVNQWLNNQLQRTEFMPFAPATLYEEREKCYKNIRGAEYAAEFMTITFDCTDYMIENCPAAVHVDGTARPQLVRRRTNESFYRIIHEYYKLTGIPSIINTSFNIHEEPIVCTPGDAIRAFKKGRLHYLAMGPFLVKGNNA